MKKYKRYQSYWRENDEWEEGLVITAFSAKEAEQLADDIYGDDCKVKLLKDKK